MHRLLVVTGFIAGCSTAASMPTVHVPAPVEVAVVAREPARLTSTIRAFVFRAGDPSDDLGSYATEYWGEHGMSVFSSPATAREGDVLDDPGMERLIAVGRYAVIHVRTRGGYFLRDFGERGWVVELRTRDVIGSGQHDLHIEYTLTDPGDAVDWERWRISHAEPPQVTSFRHFVTELWTLRGSNPARLFAHEHETWSNCCGSESFRAPPRIENDIDLEPARITLRVAGAWRADASSFRARPLDGIPPALTPWGAVKERTFRWKGRAFVLDSER